MFAQNAGYLYNTADLGTVKSVAVTYSSGCSTSAKAGVYFGTSEQSTYTTSSNATIKGQSGTDTWSNNTTGNGFFQLSTSNKNCQITKIVITYTPVAAPTLSVAAGVFNAAFDLDISAATGRTLKYTTDGTDPSSSGTATSVSSNTTTVSIPAATTRVRAISLKDGISSLEADATYSYVDPSAPSIILSETAIAFGDIAINTNSEESFTITPYNLTSALSILCDNAKYTVSPTSVASNAGATTITVTARPTAKNDDMDATITISGGGLTENKTVTLTASPYDPCEVEYDFSKATGFSSWTSSYTEHVVSYDQATVTFSSANKQTGTITDIPVQKAGDVVVALNNRGEIMKSVAFTCRQWTTKTQTLRLYASTDGGKTWGSQIGNDETDFDIASASLPENTNAVKLTTTEDNQVGIESVSFVIDGEHFNIHITDAGWASISYAKEVAIPTGVTAYYAQKKDESTITLKEITGGYIPANTGVVVSGDEGTYTANVTSTSATLGATNLLKPWLTAGTPDGTYYTLAAGPTFKQSTGGILAAGKAYLVMPAGAPSLGVEFESTNITTTNFTNDTKNSEFFNLAGQRVTNPTKGLYIVNGKKVVIK